MNIIDLMHGLNRIMCDDFRIIPHVIRVNKDVFEVNMANEFAELLLCAEAQGWINVREPNLFPWKGANSLCHPCEINGSTDYVTYTTGGDWVWFDSNKKGGKK